MQTGMNIVHTRFWLQKCILTAISKSMEICYTILTKGERAAFQIKETDEWFGARAQKYPLTFAPHSMLNHIVAMYLRHAPFIDNQIFFWRCHHDT